MLGKVQDSYRSAELVDFFELMKPRVMRLVIFTASVGMFAAQEYIHPVMAIASIILIGLGAGASGALNMWWDADIDAVMERTSSRPVPSGKVKAEDALFFGVFLSIFSVIFLGLFTNLLAAAILGFTILFYIIVYSMWLKRATSQNIVIGGAAGAFPPIIGWAVTTGSIELESILMFLLIFVWTPPHFWALSLFSHSDYRRAKIPMLTVTHGKAHTRRNILFYSVALALLSIGISFSPLGGVLYFCAALILNGYFLYLAAIVYMQNEKSANKTKMAYERRLFMFSIFYMFFIFGFILLEALVDRLGGSFMNIDYSAMLYVI